MSDGGLVVRLGRIEDLRAVVALERTSEVAPHWAESVYEGVLEGRGGDAGSAGRAHCLLVAEWVGSAEPVGFGVASLVRGMQTAEVENLAVEQGRRRRGVGRAICEGLIAWAGMGGAAEVDLEVRAGNVGARRLYERLGFVEAGLRRGYYGDGEDALLLRLALTSSRLH